MTTGSITGGVGHNLPQEAPAGLCQRTIDVDAKFPDRL